MSKAGWIYKKPSVLRPNREWKKYVELKQIAIFCCFDVKMTNAKGEYNLSLDFVKLWTDAATAVQVYVAE